MRLSVLTYLVILAGVIVWCGGILLAPMCTAAGGDGAVVGRALYAFYHPICHQIPSRSYFVAGHPLGVCVRCSSIYAAFLAGTMLFPLLRRFVVLRASARWILFFAAVPMFVDATWVGSLLYEVTCLTRVVSGAVFGLVLPFVLLPAALEASRELFSHVHQRKGLSDA